VQATDGQLWAKKSFIRFPLVHPIQLSLMISIENLILPFRQGEDELVPSLLTEWLITEFH
jgi:hypothetical protein